MSRPASLCPPDTFTELIQHLMADALLTTDFFESTGLPLFESTNGTLHLDERCRPDHPSTAVNASAAELLQLSISWCANCSTGPALHRWLHRSQHAYWIDRDALRAAWQLTEVLHPTRQVLRLLTAHDPDTTWREVMPLIEFVVSVDERISEVLVVPTSPWKTGIEFLYTTLSDSLEACMAELRSDPRHARDVLTSIRQALISETKTPSFHLDYTDTLVTWAPFPALNAKLSLAWATFAIFDLITDTTAACLWLPRYAIDYLLSISGGVAQYRESYIALAPTPYNLAEVTAHLWEPWSKTMGELTTVIAAAHAVLVRNSPTPAVTTITAGRLLREDRDSYQP